ncbi:MAG: 50S ribosomal protein L22 [uncultured bacterium]|nr:MAG: 50S ribosomal protein L22 [uncultured bacterium]OFW69805.1 MAG: 50S ribosomal protein L22 [Alphaproteobacteria bacterium GWC2_42_16]OFW74404.1 MAG: 50S ribosomal protein L22 [Alphaproteobacteria bacterium GWA2_41_27]OFW82497.1 MAG: 50S ribosomal protein L22 [Alphaproteobacteria bacterium RIFCSPHIGHO2_12_FULL_42_100]OFW85085.1 MAG: 50S ribosomal protein L22 [Alphaproteobacteria bacterium RBG_16_42_14]OFW91608.1 MAG: 50S ribosomal protein L22 [Alphaproteobacteria bacterium RIFCSPHIGHO2_1
MSKAKTPRALPDYSAMANLRMLRISPRKLNLVAGMIRGQRVDKALNTLTFSPKRIAQDVKKALMSAISNAENNHGLDIDKLYVSEAIVGKALVMKRLDIRGRSKAGRIKKPFSHLRIVVSEIGEVV